MDFKLNQTDKWLIAAVNEELQSRFGVSNEMANELIRKSNLMRMLMEGPDFAHHEGPESWVRIIAKSNKLKVKFIENMVTF